MRDGLHPLSQWYIGVPERVFVDPPRDYGEGIAWRVGRPGQSMTATGRPPSTSPHPVAILAQAGEEEEGDFPQVGEDLEEGLDFRDHDPFGEGHVVPEFVPPR